MNEPLSLDATIRDPWAGPAVQPDCASLRAIRDDLRGKGWLRIGCLVALQSRWMGEFPGLWMVAEALWYRGEAELAEAPAGTMAGNPVGLRIWIRVIDQPVQRTLFDVVEA